MAEYHVNSFRILGDIAHALSKIILIGTIHWNRSAEGVSLITQLLYLLVFCTRYLDIFWTPVNDGMLIYLFVFKVAYIVSSAYIVFLMWSIFPRTREREKAWRFGAYGLGAALIGCVPVLIIFENIGALSPLEVLWVFSIILESLCILPQLLLLRETTVPTVIDSLYLLTLGSYRAFYILNWIYRGATEHVFDPVAAIFGVIQTAFYVDFAWVYYSRQRVKLRGGGVVDSDDFSRGWLVGGILGRKHLDDNDADDGEADHARPAQKNTRWGGRGISISADDTVRDIERGSDDGARMPLTDPSAFEDDSDDEAPPPNAKHRPERLEDGDEWRDD
ncbi:hypothetical protein P152DRAFT_441861 [Eremomyces bilateralis CBS 781.70]|uniref:ER lumen protein retaining receptor n=1 Tax=Eremomyces bilateralis CBS 781.70 TaxID=1392243 RepID=A0A6G1FUB5_9PEZI|nr:uncharacterized protein P152DRAFT_441861 [Eremomyces bilateralis CBS 781.70]KAF1809340.1 hypothetical protein P152DRAFT_441861 [Eremomyces bilateralis CBS 781.70]